MFVWNKSHSSGLQNNENHSNVYIDCSMTTLKQLLKRHLILKYQMNRNRIR